MGNTLVQSWLCDFIVHDLTSTPEVCSGQSWTTQAFDMVRVKLLEMKTNLSWRVQVGGKRQFKGTQRCGWGSQ